MRIATWNVNSIRSRQSHVMAWVECHRPDVLVMQETKAPDDVALGPAGLGPLRDAGYEVAHHGRDHWNGVAIASRVGLDDVRRGFGGTNRAPYDEARLISAQCGGIRVHGLYAPNGRALDDPHYLYKLVWFERLRATIRNDGPTVVAGDFNVAPDDIDIYDPARWRRRTHASPPERAAVAALQDLGLSDVTRRHLPKAGVYTWWSYRPGQFAQNRGLRIDLALCSEDVAERITRVWVDTEERAQPKPSDHAPLVLDLA